MFISEQLISLFQGLGSDFINCIKLIDSLCFEQAGTELNKIRTVIDSQNTKWSNERDEVLNEVYLLNRFVDLLSSYSAIWMNIAESKLTNSWNSLQDSMDHLRSVKKISNGTEMRLLDFLENQLIDLEKLYPYNMFFSMGVKVDWFECSICGKDIDSIECEHTKGELYRGKVAYGIAKNIGYVDHVGIVKYPADKRCVVQYDDDGPQFEVLRYVTGLLTSQKMRPLSFHHLHFSQRTKKNPEFKKLPRNAVCFCGSGRKFKKCCISKEFVEFDHIDIVTREIDKEEDGGGGAALLLQIDE
ncbi:MAG: SEC-C domain-containing protein [Thermodesulfovibrionales bacterium]|nr:SEC-C domain-containing protein [Thermodesulfovibrionales bacterium]